MKVSLLAITPNFIDIIYTAARTCYSSKSPNELYAKSIEKSEEDKLKFIKRIIKAGHYSVLEHVNVTFSIEGISRACSHQLVRHRHCSFSQQSQRYVKIKEDDERIRKLLDCVLFEGDNEAIKACVELEDIAKKYFVDVTPGNSYQYAQSLFAYLEQIKAGVKAEDARNQLPNGAKTNLVVTCNLRELIHLANLRLCTRAQKEIRDLITKMTNLVIKKASWLDDTLVPKCKLHGFCVENNCCGLQPHISKLTANNA